ncbi:MAG: GTP pyrophosphokinase [Desulfobulbaceae bacterium A2]|nr:MAG: GTP pyrophosphokinase [Desulfobulbaceae bacterium A2]
MKKPFDLQAYRNELRQLLGDDPENELFWRALDFAVQAHSDQWRRSGDAYIMHPCGVALILSRELHVATPGVLAAALLHDTVEDVEGVTPELVEELFGEDVRKMVEGCTKVTREGSDPQRKRQEAHRSLFAGAAVKPEVLVIKLADRLHNLRTLSSMPKPKRQKIADESLDIYAPLAGRLGLFGIKRELYNLALAHKFPSQSKRLRAKIERLAQDPAALRVVTSLRENLVRAGFACGVELRTKDLWGYYDTKNRILVQQIETPQEVHIVPTSHMDCYHAMGLLNQLYPPIPRTIRDFVANPKPTGYQGIHSRANIGGQKYLFKIRSEEMGQGARFGLVHDLTDPRRQQVRYRQIQEEFGSLGNAEEIVSYRELLESGSRKEIYTYTPKGDLFCLPSQSTVLDFAFRVHTEIGHSCLGARINLKREVLPPGQRLHDGDMVEILCAKKPVHFEPEVVALCQTERARSELQRSFRERRRLFCTRVGAALLHQEMRRHGIPVEVLDQPEMALMRDVLHVASNEELFLRIGEGRRRLGAILYEIRHGLCVRKPLQPPTGTLNRVDLDALDPVLVKFSDCCTPRPTERTLVALLRPNGLSVHRIGCARLPEIQVQRDDLVGVRWLLRKTPLVKPQHLFFSAISRGQLFRLLAGAPEQTQLLSLEALASRKDVEDAWDITFRVANLHELAQLLRYLDASRQPYEYLVEL